MADEKRETERLQMPAALEGEIMVFQPMAIRDIGTGGITVETAFPLQLNSLHELRLSLGPRCVVVKGRVVHGRISDVHQDIVCYLNGLEFVDVSEHAALALAEFVSASRIGRNGA